jgi:hypothetical protein
MTMTYFLFVGLLALLILITDFLLHIPEKVKKILSITGLVMIGVGTIGNWFYPSYGLRASWGAWLMTFGGALLVVGVFDILAACRSYPCEPSSVTERVFYLAR